MTASRSFDSSSGRKSAYVVTTTANADTLEMDIENCDKVSIHTPLTYADIIEWQVSSIDSPGTNDWQTLTNNTGTNPFDAPAAKATLTHVVETFKKLRLLRTGIASGSLTFDVGFSRAKS